MTKRENLVSNCQNNKSYRMKAMNPSCVSMLRKGKEEFGVVLKSAHGTGSIVESVVEGSAAGQCCKCHIGDRLLAVNNLNVLYLNFRITGFLIENSGNSITLMFWSSEGGISNTPTSMQGEEISVEVQLREQVKLCLAGASKTIPLFIHGISLRECTNNDKLLVGDIIEEIQNENTKNMACGYPIELGKKPVKLLVKRGRCKELTNSGFRARAMDSIYPYSITVSRQDDDFGFTIKPYDHELGSILANVVKDSPAAQCGLCPGARILAVDDFNVFHMDFQITRHFIQNAGKSVTLTFCPSHGDSSRTPATSQEQEAFRELLLYKSLNSQIDMFRGKEFPIFVTSVLICRNDCEEDMILVGDEILEINGKKSKNMTLKEAVDMFEKSSSLIMLVKRGCCIKEHTSNNTVLAAQKMPQTSLRYRQSGSLVLRGQGYDENADKLYISHWPKKEENTCIKLF